MTLVADAVGLKTRPWSGLLDARWLMGYAAALGRTDDVYFDSTQPGGVLAHPMFSISPEWALLTNPDTGLDVGLSPSEALRGVHASHDLHIHAPIRQDTPVTVHAELTGAQRTAAGALMTVRFDGVGDDGATLWTSHMGAMYRGVEVDGEDRDPDAPDLPSEPGEPTAQERTLSLERTAGVVYNEAGRLFNPIHSDRAIARAAGLPDPILHGSASLAHGVDWALEVLGGDPAEVVRIGGSFRGIVVLPGDLTLAVTATGRLASGERLARFEVRNADGAVAVRDGFLVLAA